MKSERKNGSKEKHNTEPSASPQIAIILFKGLTLDPITSTQIQKYQNNTNRQKRQTKRQTIRQTKEKPRAASVENTVSLPRQRERRGKSREERAARQRKRRERQRERREKSREERKKRRDLRDRNGEKITTD